MMPYMQYFSNAWQLDNVGSIVSNVLGHVEFWGEDLRLLPGFEAAVSDALDGILRLGARTAVQEWMK